jgi:hypothetical protein
LAQALYPVLGGLGALVVLGAVVWGAATVLTHNRKVQLRLGDRYFDAGQIDRIKRQYDRAGPVIYPGLVGGADQRPIAIVRTGDDPRKGWRVVFLTPPAGPKGCVLAVDRTTHELTAPCSPVRFPADGTGLDALAIDKVTIDPIGHLIIDLTKGVSTP